MNNIKDQILDTFPRNDSDEFVFDDVFVPYTNNIVPLWNTEFENAQINFDYSPFSAMFYVIREKPKDFFDMASGHLVRSRKDYEEKRKDFNNLYMKIVHGGGNGLEDGLCSMDEMIRLGSLFYVVLQTSDTSQGLVIDEQKRYKNDWCEDSKDVVFDQDEIDAKSEKLQDVYLSDCSWEEIFYRYLEQTGEDTFWFVKMPDFLSEHYKDKKIDVKDFDWIDHPDFITFTKFIDKVENQGGHIAIYYRSTDEFTEQMKDALGMVENLNGVLQNRHKHLFRDVLDRDYDVISNYDVTKPVEWNKNYGVK